MSVPGSRCLWLRAFCKVLQLQVLWCWLVLFQRIGPLWVCNKASKQLHRRILRTKSSNKEMYSKGACHNFGGKTGRPTAKRRRDKCIQQDQKRKKTFQKGPCESHFASHCYYLLYELVSTGQVLTRPTLERLYVPLSEGSRLKFEEHREIADETEMYRVGLTRRVT